ncbi:putative protein serine/threonine kinase [Cavenderia fasciculata]|uniref:non-specific serine/threonine protein kinase n=1 Tax=Cavenderia fasciculata TaxID=261658 RepID=F4PMT2_CACFS|nr:putative protein serine/threonine kinase [Cavenderia fasciculata]EGG23676.1 putative protein serine/threonine kinase [Cavenderia fasciculata]|eukprot:XP_004361527.1 putative protein serine/threonine kinase [Cavenderia fasciculata]
MSNHQSSGESSPSYSSPSPKEKEKGGSALSSPIHTLRKKGIIPKQGIRQSIEELISALTDLKDGHSNSNKDINNNQQESTTTSTTNISTPTPRSPTTSSVPTNIFASNNNNTNNNNNCNRVERASSGGAGGGGSGFIGGVVGGTSPTQRITMTNRSPSSTVVVMSQQKSLAKFYFLAQQIEYVPHSNRHIVITSPIEQDPMLPVETFSSFLKVQWTTCWTVHLVPTTTCLEVLKYISQKTSREVCHLKLADSEGVIMDHDFLLITHRCKRFVVFEDIEIDQQQQQQQDNTTSSGCSSTSSSLPSSPTISTSTSDSHSPNNIRKQAPAPPPRSPSTYNPLLVHTELISEPTGTTPTTPSSTNTTPLISGGKSTGPPLSLSNGGSGGSNTASFLSNLILNGGVGGGGGGGSNCGSTNNSPPVSPPSSRKNSGNTSQASSRPSSPNTQNNHHIGGSSGSPSNSSGNLLSSSSSSPYIYCKFLDRVEPCDVPPYTEKGKILDNYFAHYYKELLKYTQQRSLRYQRILEFVKEGGFDETGTRGWIQKHYDNETTFLRNKRAGMKLKDFKILTQIGKGGFGQVFLAVKKDTGDIVTLKRIKKQAYEWANQRTQVSHEKTVMMSEAGGKWITKLLYAFQDNHHLYLAMEYHCGGDFRAILNNLGMLSEEDARFYMVEMIEALNSLHSLGYIHRDIKPSNYVIDKHGHIRLIDFGLSKEGYESRNGLHRQSMTDLRRSCIEGKSSWRNTFTNRSNNGMIAYRRPIAHSAVGSPEYMAPEIVQDSGYDLSCDYWSLGCVFMEMLCGFNPFCADTPNDVFINIMQWDEILDWPLFTQDLSHEAADLLKKMLCLPHERFKSLEEFKSHPFFNMNGLTWDSILGQQVPPFVPKVDNDMDTSYFEDALNNDPASWEINEDNEKSRDPFSNLNIPFFTYRKSSALNVLMNN